MVGAAGRLIAVALAGAGVGVAAAPSPLQSLAGRYSAHFRNALVDGTTYWGDNVVEVVPVDPRHAYVRLSLDFYNGHRCALAGVA